MNAAPFDVAPIAIRLRELVPALRLVGMSADFAAVEKLGDHPAPCAYVILASEQASPTAYGQAPRGTKVIVQQLVPVTFGIAVAVRNYRAQSAADVADDLKQILGPIRAAIMGFVPDVSGARPCMFVRGDLQGYSAGVALWVDVYETQHSIQNT